MKKSGGMLDYGNDLKSACTDSLKKAASLLGIASDIYGKSEFKQEVGIDVINTANGVKTLPTPQITTKTAFPAPVETSPEIYCLGNNGKGCPFGSDITEQEKEYSLKIYKKPLCLLCQKEI